MKLEKGIKIIPPISYNEHKVLSEKIHIANRDYIISFLNALNNKSDNSSDFYVPSKKGFVYEWENTVNHFSKSVSEGYIIVTTDTYLKFPEMTLIKEPENISVQITVTR